MWLTNNYRAVNKLLHRSFAEFCRSLGSVEVTFVPRRQWQNAS